MKVPPASDIVGIASSFGASAHQYKEIRHDDDAYDIAQRWPMLAELHGFAPVSSGEDASAAAIAQEADAPLQGKAGFKMVGASYPEADGRHEAPPAPIQIAA